MSVFTPSPPFLSPLLLPCRSVKRYLLDLSLERAAGWREEERGRKVITDPTHATAFSQTTPSHSANGQRVIHPLPVDPTVTPSALPSSPATHHHITAGHAHSPPTPYHHPHPTTPNSCPPLSLNSGVSHFLYPQSTEVATSNLPPPPGIQPTNCECWCSIYALSTSCAHIHTRTQMQHLSMKFRECSVPWVSTISSTPL